MNNLNELNTILFDTLRSVNSNEMDHKKATVISSLGSTIINNAKVQLQASKLLKGGELETEFFGVLTSPKKAIGDKIKLHMNNESLYDKKLEYALSLGYKSLADAMTNVGKREFEQQFKEL